MQDFSTEFFILLEVLAGSYLVSKSLTSLNLLTTVYNWHTSIYVSRDGNGISRKVASGMSQTSWRASL